VLAERLLIETTQRVWAQSDDREGWVDAGDRKRSTQSGACTTRRGLRL